MITGKYDAIKELISRWEQFELTNHTKDVKNFALWLYQQETGRQLVNEYHEADIHAEAVRNVIGPAYDLFPTERKISILVNRLGRFARNYMKKALQGLPISTMEEFSFLAGVPRGHQPTKSELIQDNLMEMTTGSELIKRLLRMGLMEEFTDTQDKRVRRLCITRLGEEVRNKAIAQMGHVSRLMVARLSEEQQRQLYALLAYLDNFHIEVHRETVEMLFDDMLEMIERQE